MTSVRVVKVASVLILLVATISFSGYILIENEKLILKDGICKSFFLFPKTISEVLGSNEIRNVPPTFEMEHFFEPVNLLSRDIYGLNSYYIPDEGTWEIRLTNFRNDSIAHRWALDKSSFFQTDRLYPNSEPRNPILLSNRHLIVGNDESKNLYRLNKESEVIWHNKEKRFHHAMNLADDGNIWICTSEPRNIQVRKKTGMVNSCYTDNFITKVDIETGEIIYHKSTSEILSENGYRGIVYGVSNSIDEREGDDPLHLNDIEPVMTDGPYWNQGDLLLSFRHRSLLLLYRPMNNRIVKLIYGPFLQQHDVDIINDSTISVFSNEGTNIGKIQDDADGNSQLIVHDSITNSNIVHYCLSNSTSSYPFDHHFFKHSIFTNTQGLHQHLADGSVYVEQHGHGIMFFMNDSEVLYKMQSSHKVDGWVERPHWIRIYENIDF